MFIKNKQIKSYLQNIVSNINSNYGGQTSITTGGTSGTSFTTGGTSGTLISTGGTSGTSYATGGTSGSSINFGGASGTSFIGGTSGTSSTYNGAINQGANTEFQRLIAETSKLSSKMSPLACCSSFAAKEKIVAILSGLSLLA